MKTKNKKLFFVVFLGFSLQLRAIDPFTLVFAACWNTPYVVATVSALFGTAAGGAWWAHREYLDPEVAKNRIKDGFKKYADQCQRRKSELLEALQGKSLMPGRVNELLETFKQRGREGEAFSLVLDRSHNDVLSDLPQLDSPQLVFPQLDLSQLDSLQLDSPQLDLPQRSFVDYLTTGYADSRRRLGAILQLLLSPKMLQPSIRPSGPQKKKPFQKPPGYQKRPPKYRKRPFGLRKRPSGLPKRPSGYPKKLPGCINKQLRVVVRNLRLL